jgi:uroporphyrinogen-III synthase
VPLDFDMPEGPFDFVLFQSQKAVRHFFAKCSLTGKEKILAVGEKTKAEAEKHGYNVWAVPTEFYAEEVSKLLQGYGGRVLIPRSSVGREEAIESLRKLGFEVVSLDVYETRLLDYPPEEFEAKVQLSDFLVFASPSAVKGFFANLQKLRDKSLLKDKKIVCIGKTTKGEWERTFGTPCETPEKPTMEDLLKLIKKLA